MRVASVATLAATAAMLPSVALAKDARTFAVMYFNGDKPLIRARMDPIVSPGKASGHQHMVQGGNAFALSMSDDATSRGTCTTAQLQADMSNYWVPDLFFQAKNGSLIPVDVFYMKVYYFFEATNDKIQAFPRGARMVSGDQSSRSPPKTGDLVLDAKQGTIQSVQFTCPRQNFNTPNYGSDKNKGIGDSQNKGAGVGFPDANCDGYAAPLRMDIHFPSCYKPGADYRSNTAWPTSVGGNKEDCPQGYIHTPHLFYEVYWNTLLFQHEWTPGQGKQPFVLASGDTTGFGLHADFISGWDTNVLQTIIDTCDEGNNGMIKCRNAGPIADNKVKCNVKSPIDEDNMGPFQKLPGCNPLTAAGPNTQAAPCPEPKMLSGRSESPAAQPQRRAKHLSRHAAASA